MENLIKISQIACTIAGITVQKQAQQYVLLKNDQLVLPVRHKLPCVEVLNVYSELECNMSTVFEFYRCVQ